jgi:translation initiation factor 2 subunit 3
MAQAEVNIGTIGHVDHGKTSLVQALTGKWTDTHSEELKRGITIKLGYADATFYRCVKCSAPQCFSTKQECPVCNRKTERLRKISFVDAPGHETLMATVIAASSIIDGALFLIAATEKCPMPQTVEHLAVLEAAGIRNVVVVQNKIDLVSKERALEHCKEIREFLKGSSYESAQIIPVVANQGINLDALIQAMEKDIPTPKREPSDSPILYVARSFDVNKPGSRISDLHGGVVGGSVIRGAFKVGDEVELLPGPARKKKEKTSYVRLKSKIVSLHAGAEQLQEAVPGGLIAMGLEVDPAVSRADSLVGCTVGHPGKLPALVDEVRIRIAPLARTMEIFPAGLGKDEPLVLGVGTNTTIGFVTDKKKNVVALKLRKPACIDSGSKIAVMRQAQKRWRLYGTASLCPAGS